MGRLGRQFPVEPKSLRIRRLSQPVLAAALFVASERIEFQCCVAGRRRRQFSRYARPRCSLLYRSLSCFRAEAEGTNRCRHDP